MKEDLIDILKKNGITELTIADVGAKDSLDFIKEVSGITTMHAFEPNPEECKKLEALYKNHSFKSKSNSFRGKNRIGNISCYKTCLYEQSSKTRSGKLSKTFWFLQRVWQVERICTN